MLNKNTFREQMDRLLYLYPIWKIEYTNSKAVKTWYDCFKHIDDMQFTKMVDKYIYTQTWNPTVAGILSYKEKECSYVE